VTDTGIGIPEENFNKIFQPFFTTKGSQATGLGLMITSAIVQNLGGTIGLKSKPGEGTSFRIALPVADRSS
jgi:signal transduction histidine kinase